MSSQIEHGVNAIQKLRRKMIAISMAVLLFLVLYLLTTAYYKSVAMAQKQVLKRLHSITMTLAPHLPFSAHQRLIRRYPKRAKTKQKEQTLNKKLRRDFDYANLHSILKLAQTYNQLETSIYTLVLSKQKKQFSFIATSADKPYYRHRYKTFPKQLLRKFDKGGMIGPYKDKHGTWLSAFCPLKDSKGHVYAIVQADQQFDTFLQQARVDFIRGLLISLSVIVGFALLFYFLLSGVVKETVILFTRNAEISKELEKTNDKLQKQHKELNDSQLKLQQQHKE